ncbi:MAG: segregation/condensation protein A [Patescibacteria group bacterium]
MYELKLQQFSGPIEKLFELIEEKKMEITDLNLAEITADFLRYLQSLNQSNPRLIADFVVVAAKLLIIKSKALLPTLELTGEEEADINDLKGRLERYREFKPAIVDFKKLWERGNFSVSRSFFAGLPPIFYPSKNLDIKALKETLEKILLIFTADELESQTIESSLIKLEEKIDEIIHKISGSNNMLEFNQLSKEKSRTEIIVLFLAILHLLRDQLIKVEQREKFGDIIISK